jgi:hypothetical protein
MPRKGLYIMDIRFTHLINEIINVAPAAASEFYTKQKYAKERLESLKAELVQRIEELEAKCRSSKT